MALDPTASATTTATPTITTTSTITPRPFANLNTYPNPTPPSTRPISPLPHPHSHHPYPTAAAQSIRTTLTHPQQQGILYPVASSGRGFIPKTPMQTVTVAANPAAPYAPRPLVSYPHSHPLHLMRPPNPHHHLHPQLGGPGLASGSVPIKGIPVSSPQPKVPPSLSDCNGYKDTRDRSRDDSLTTVRDRKPQYGDAVKSLPKPLPMPAGATHLPKREEADEEEAADKEDEESVEHLLPQDLLKRHVKHAKRIRARLREERLQRIARYKSRLALLLPPLVEQFRNDTAARN
ncbi:extensin isoform X2 [Carya illinoinensis]|uniref:extensin isoform X2 n=1 Tax=Carya illinoinensis TaxID=32201 RepID=UPI001C71D1AC|nr:extensin isoform X2 [Carya illinoinensis]